MFAIFSNGPFEFVALQPDLTILIKTIEYLTGELCPHFSRQLVSLLKILGKFLDRKTLITKT